MSDRAGRPSLAAHIAPFRDRLRVYWHDPKNLHSREPTALLIGGVIFSIVYYLSLPPWPNFQGFGHYLFGPLPAALAAPVGLLVHQRAPRFLQYLGAATFAFIASVAVVIFPGVLVFGFRVPVFLYRVCAAAFSPFDALQFLAYPHLFVAAIWATLKAFLSWAAILYGALLAWRYDLFERAKPAMRGIGLSWSFSREQRRIRRAWQRDYLECRRAGVPPPPPPPELTVAGGHHPLMHAHTALIVLRIGVVLAGLFGVWSALSGHLTDIIATVMFGSAL